MLLDLGDSTLTAAEEAAVRAKAAQTFKDTAYFSYGPPVSAAGPAPKKKPAKKKPAKKASAPKGLIPTTTSRDSTITYGLPKDNAPKIFGVPKQYAMMVGAGVAALGGMFLFSQLLEAGHQSARRRARARNGRRVSNPRGVQSRHPEVQKAIEFRKEFHWGIPAKKVARRRISPSPKVLVELGKVYSVTYRTKKRGESAHLFEHKFEGRLPALAMDIRNKRLHVVGGTYTVTADGITG